MSYSVAKGEGGSVEKGKVVRSFSLLKFIREDGVWGYTKKRMVFGTL